MDMNTLTAQKDVGNDVFDHENVRANSKLGEEEDVEVSTAKARDRLASDVVWEVSPRCHLTLLFFLLHTHDSRTITNLSLFLYYSLSMS